jgi:hypothetical protein
MTRGSRIGHSDRQHLEHALAAHRQHRTAVWVTERHCTSASRMRGHIVDPHINAIRIIRGHCDSRTIRRYAKHHAACYI